MSASLESGGERLAVEIVESFRRAVEAVEAARPQAHAIALKLAEIYENGGRLIYVGSGASGLIAAEDASELPGTFGLARERIAIVLAGGAERPFATPASVEDDMPAARREIAALGDVSRDAAIAVSASGTTPFTVAAAQTARAKGAFVVGVACRPGAALVKIADAPLIIDVGEEALAGSTRLAAGTAQKCALGLISTLLGDALGHVCAGLMVNVQADNEKLRQRAEDIVAAITGANAEKARAALDEAGGDVKRAVLIVSGARGPADAASRLQRWRGRIPPALEELRREAELKMRV